VYSCYFDLEKPCAKFTRYRQLQFTLYMYSSLKYI